ncbi:MAG: hypothetical protein ABIP17_06775 [Ilumatobacteraceae bacterium]
MQATDQQHRLHHFRLDRVVDRIDATSAVNVGIIATVFGTIVAALDLATGSELSASIFYVGTPHDLSN